MSLGLPERGLQTFQLVEEPNAWFQSSKSTRQSPSCSAVERAPVQVCGDGAVLICLCYLLSGLTFNREMSRGTGLSSWDSWKEQRERGHLLSVNSWLTEAVGPWTTGCARPRGPPQSGNSHGSCSPRRALHGALGIYPWGLGNHGLPELQGEVPLVPRPA